MLRRLLYALSVAAAFSAAVGSPIAILLLLVAPHVPWWGATLEKYTWLAILLAGVFVSRFVVGAVLYYSGRKHQRFLLSPEGKRRRAEEVQKIISTIIAEAEASPTPKLDEAACGGAFAASVITEARRLARETAKEQLRRRGVKIPWEVDTKELARIADTLLATDSNLIGMAKANLEKRASVRNLRGRG